MIWVAFSSHLTFYPETTTQFPLKLVIYLYHFLVPRCEWALTAITGLANEIIHFSFPFIIHFPNTAHIFHGLIVNVVVFSWSFPEAATIACYLCSVSVLTGNPSRHNLEYPCNFFSTLPLFMSDRAFSLLVIPAFCSIVWTFKQINQSRATLKGRGCLDVFY